jgi:hypothetical protein
MGERRLVAERSGKQIRKTSSAAMNANVLLMEEVEETDSRVCRQQQARSTGGHAWGEDGNKRVHAGHRC